MVSSTSTSNRLKRRQLGLTGGIVGFDQFQQSLAVTTQRLMQLADGKVEAHLRLERKNRQVPHLDAVQHLVEVGLVTRAQVQRVTLLDELRGAERQRLVVIARVTVVRADRELAADRHAFRLPLHLQRKILQRGLKQWFGAVVDLGLQGRPFPVATEADQLHLLHIALQGES